MTDESVVVAEVVAEKIEQKPTKSGVEPETLTPPEVGARRIVSLRCFEQVDAMLGNGVSVPKIAKWIREDANELTDISESTVIHHLYLHVKKMKKKYGDVRAPREHVSLLKTVEEKVDPEDGLNLLYALQMERVGIELNIERNISKTVSLNNANIRLAMDILATIDAVRKNNLFARFKYSSNDGNKSAAERALDGITKTKEQFERQFGQSTTSIMMNPESRHKILSALEAVKKGDSGPLHDLIKRRFGSRYDESVQRDVRELDIAARKGEGTVDSE